MIINESQDNGNNKYQEFHINRDNWRDRGGAIAFEYERDDGTRMYPPVNIPKSQIIKEETNSRGITTFKITKWILKKKLRPGYRLVEW